VFDQQKPSPVTHSIAFFTSLKCFFV